MTTIRPAQPKDFLQLAAMRALLWPDASFSEHFAELEAGLTNPGQPGFPVAVLVAEDPHGTLTGFLEAGLRSHADGCDPARPVGFVEGWFVVEEDRRKGIGRALMRAAEEWARAQGLPRNGLRRPHRQPRIGTRSHRLGLRGSRSLHPLPQSSLMW